MKVLECGEQVKLGGHIGTIVAICIRGPLVTYEVVWYNDGERCSAWVQDLEFTTASNNPKRMGL